MTRGTKMVSTDLCQEPRCRLTLLVFPPDFMLTHSELYLFCFHPNVEMSSQEQKSLDSSVVILGDRSLASLISLPLGPGLKQCQCSTPVPADNEALHVWSALQTLSSPACMGPECSSHIPTEKWLFSVAEDQPHWSAGVCEGKRTFLLAAAGARPSGSRQYLL